MVTREPTGGRNNDDPTRAMTTGETGTTGSAYDRSGGNVTGTTSESTTYSPHGAGSGSLDETRASGGTASGMSGSGSGESVKDKASDMADTARDKAGEATQVARDKASEATAAAKDKLSDATDTIDGQRDTVAGGLDSVASQLRDRAETIPGGDKTTQMAQTAAVKIESASGYLRENEVSDMMTDVERLVRTHPTESLVVALAAGFLLGRAMKG